MIILDTLLTGGIRFVLDKIATAVDRELNPEDGEGALREELLALQMRLELGEIDEGDYAAEEAELMARLREVRARRSAESEGPGLAGAGNEQDSGRAAGAGGGGALSFDSRRHTIGVEVSFAGEEEPE